MRSIVCLLVVGIVACASSPPPQPASPPNGRSEEVGVYGPAGLAPAAKPPEQPEPAKPPNPPNPLYARLAVGSGTMPGLDAVAIARTRDAKHCGGLAVGFVRDPGKAVSPDDAELAAMLDVRAPEDLDFTEPHKQESLAR